MIRKIKPEDIETVMDIWLKTSTSAHNFISENYWAENYDIVKKKYLPNSENYVYDENDEIKAFISIMDSHWIGALFVDQKYQNQQIGRKLIEYCKKLYNHLNLAAYADNEKAVRFYQKNGFKIIQKQLNEDSQFPEYIMEWDEKDESAS
ncbi:MAG: N-acetyltransferase [Dysgonomonas sp.]